ncbi:hypothetical protein LshimejAT787_3000120 [Lyophyllum shimeji]|uniref:Retrotransposon gag domain-containing protein n=1 Tax=Lyophyllum shimeji TaxID=47721 RepID=A0A9P3UUN4_LYOSH|nr:hypothetical protein LshimejAT787_3000120 [Lyophyllum shimeji]
MRLKSHGRVLRFGTYAEFRAQFTTEFCPRDEKRKAATTFETSAYHQGSHSVDEYINEFQDLAEEAQFPDGTQLVFRFRHIGNGMGKPWVVLKQPTPIPIKTHTHVIMGHYMMGFRGSAYGCGFYYGFKQRYETKFNI